MNDLSEAKQIWTSQAKHWFQLAERLDWSSYDPYDFLLSPYLCWLQRASPLGARISIQVGKSSGAPSRQILGIRPHQEAKTLSDYISAAVILARANVAWASSYVDLLLDLLDKRAIVTPQGKGWGLEFPYTSRYVNAPARTPNAYQTVYTIHALLDAYEKTGNSLGVQSAAEGCRFIREGLGDFEYGGRRWFYYWPARQIPAPNVQALIASAFARSGPILGDTELSRLADRCAEVVISAQRMDGSWPYSEDGRANFVDGFHTGFILQGLAEYLRYRDLANPDVLNSLDRGLRFFREHLVTQDKLPRYFADGPVSLDGQNFAQCIQTLTVCAQNQRDLEIARSMWMSVYHPDQFRTIGSSLQKQIGAAIQFPELRWTIGPAVLATAHLVFASVSTWSN